jgi:DNA primase
VLGVGFSMILSIKDFSPERLSEKLDGIDNEEKRGIATSLAIGEDVWEYEGCLKLIAQFEASRNRQNKALLQEIKAAEENNNQVLLVELLQQKQAQSKNKCHR